MRAAGSSGMTIAQPAKSTRIEDRNLRRALMDYFQNNRYDMVIVILNNSSTCYNYVKQASEIAVGCLTQCLKSNTVYRLNPTTVSNILLKINAKLNGTNHFLPGLRTFFQRPCMIMGADVTHPGPDNRDFPSVAAVTASIDINFFRYSFEWRLQPSRQEMIEDLEAITREHLLNFYRRNNKIKPERIIYVRDGVSDGQFIQVLNVELMAIRTACQKLEPGYKPSIVFIVVQKRHHTRFFPKDSRISEDRNMNVPAGTCVDTEITNPSLIDFYLVSHASIQGVAKPTKYVKLWDDCDMSEDDLEKLMYYLCHLFARCNRSVSYPAPTYYAHLAAARARVYCEIENIDMRNLRREQDRLKIKENISKDMPMFFV